MTRTGRAAPVAALAAALCACQSVPYTGRSHLMLVSEAEEKTLGDEAYRETLKKARPSSDRAAVDMVRGAGRRIAAAADRPDFQWEFALIEDSKTVNAFCLPGGKVAVYSGILPVAKGEEGLAVVLGHEIAHALARHGAERMSQGMLANFGGQALSVLLATKSPATRQLFGNAYGLGVGLGVMLPYSRRQESEADHIGLILMAEAGYDPGEALLFWRRMEALEEGGQKSPVADFLRTHPSSAQRQKQIEAWLPEARKRLPARR